MFKKAWRHPQLKNPLLHQQKFADVSRNHERRVSDNVFNNFFYL